MGRGGVQFMGACVMENGDTVILMELMLGGTLLEAIATDRASWYNRRAAGLETVLQHVVARWKRKREVGNSARVF